jgi:hypothetical protein
VTARQVFQRTPFFRSCCCLLLSPNINSFHFVLLHRRASSCLSLQLNDQRRTNPRSFLLPSCRRSRKIHVVIKLWAISTSRCAEMDASTTQVFVWQTHGTVVDGTNSAAANGTSSIDSTLAACYNVPYGGWGSGFHFLFFWGWICILCCRTPFWPWRSLTTPRIGYLWFFISLPIFASVAYFSLIDTRCKHDNV